MIIKFDNFNESKINNFRELHTRVSNAFAYITDEYPDTLIKRVNKGVSNLSEVVRIDVTIKNITNDINKSDVLEYANIIEQWLELIKDVDVAVSQVTADKSIRAYYNIIKDIKISFYSNSSDNIIVKDSDKIFLSTVNLIQYLSKIEGGVNTNILTGVIHIINNGSPGIIIQFDKVVSVISIFNNIQNLFREYNLEISKKRYYNDHKQIGFEILNFTGTIIKSDVI